MAETEQTVHVHVEGKNMALAYVLWFFLGIFGVHRFYLERTGTGVTQLILWVVGAFTAAFMVGIPLLMIAGIWWLVDAFLVQAIVSRYNRSHGVPSSGGFRLTTQGGASVPEKEDELVTFERLHALREKGALTEEEYAARKARVLAE